MACKKEYAIITHYLPLYGALVFQWVFYRPPAVSFVFGAIFKGSVLISGNYPHLQAVHC